MPESQNNDDIDETDAALHVFVRRITETRTLEKNFTETEIPRQFDEIETRRSKPSNQILFIYLVY